MRNGPNLMFQNAFKKRAIDEFFNIHKAKRTDRFEKKELTNVNIKFTSIMIIIIEKCVMFLCVWPLEVTGEKYSYLICW